MIVLVRPEATEKLIADLTETVRKMGLEVSPLEHGKGRGFEVTGDDRGRVLALREAPGVLEILTRRVALKGGAPLWPHFCLRVGILVLGLAVALLLLSAFLPPGLGDRAVPEGGASSGVVEWYLLPLQGFLALFSGRARWVGGLLVLLFWLLFFFWPFLDRADESTAHKKRGIFLIRAMGVVILVFVVVLALGVRG